METGQSASNTPGKLRSQPEFENTRRGNYKPNNPWIVWQHSKTIKLGMRVAPPSNTGMRFFVTILGAD